MSWTADAVFLWWRDFVEFNKNVSKVSHLKLELKFQQRSQWKQWDGALVQHFQETLKPGKTTQTNPVGALENSRVDSYVISDPRWAHCRSAMPCSMVHAQLSIILKTIAYVFHGFRNYLQTQDNFFFLIFKFIEWVRPSRTHSDWGAAVKKATVSGCCLRPTLTVEANDRQSGAWEERLRREALWGNRILKTSHICRGT